MPEAHPIILFAGECVLCSANAQFVLTHDKACRYRLVLMQGEVGAALCRRHGVDPNDPDTMLIIDGDKVLRDSDAVLSIYIGLGWPWRIAALVLLVPRWMRDPAYRWVARNRYRIFGRRETCWIPNAEHADRLI